MKAILNASFFEGPKNTIILHPNVKEIGRAGESRILKCEVCGETWREATNAPQVVSDSELDKLNENKHITIVSCI